MNPYADIPLDVNLKTGKLATEAELQAEREAMIKDLQKQFTDALQAGNAGVDPGHMPPSRR